MNKIHQQCDGLNTNRKTTKHNPKYKKNHNLTKIPNYARLVTFLIKHIHQLHDDIHGRT